MNKKQNRLVGIPSNTCAASTAADCTTLYPQQSIDISTAHAHSGITGSCRSSHVLSIRSEA